MTSRTPSGIRTVQLFFLGGSPLIWTDQPLSQRLWLIVIPAVGTIIVG